MERNPGQDPEPDGPFDPDDPGAPGASDGDPEDLEGLVDSAEAAAGRAALVSGFAKGGVWDGHPPGPELAAALARAAGPEFRCAGATGEELIGLLRGMQALQSWASAGLLGVVRALIRDDDLSYLDRPRHGDLPDGWDDSLTHEIALALAVSVPSAQKTAKAAWELGARLPGAGLLLRDGTLDLPRARLIAEVFENLSDSDAARAEELLLPELAGPARKTYTQIERLASAIAEAVDPGLAERQRRDAERNRSRVQMFREQSGTAALSGRDLATDQTLAAYANLDARARQYKESGAFPGERIDRLRATAYLDILNGITAGQRIADGQLSADDPGKTDGPGQTADGPGQAADGPGQAADGPGAASPDDGAGPGGDAGPAPGGSGCPCRECDGRCAPPDDDLPDDEPDDGEPDDGGDRGPGPGKGGPGPGAGRDDGPRDDHRPKTGPTPPRPPSSGSVDETKPTLTDLVLPLATLLGLARRPGEGHALGTLDPELCRTLAATAALSPRTTLCLTITNPDGIAIGHGCAKAGRLGRPPGGPTQPLVALPARINLTITAERLGELCGRPEAKAPGPPGTGWAFARGGAGPPGDPDWCGPWTLTLPTGLHYTVIIEPVPTFGCDHRNESHAYKPNDTLRHLVQIRDYTCTFPSCSRHARESDFEHAVPYDQGGPTCACNAGARSRQCHRVKQSPGWQVTQPQPGWHQWTTPRGRTYTQGPNHYPV